MYSDNNKILFSEYCTINEIHFCKQKLKAKLFSTFCKLAKEGERYTLVYWYSLVPLTKKSTSYQLSISAVIKDKHRDTEDMLRKIIPNMQKSVFSLFSGLFKLNKNHNKFIGEEYMIIKCPKCNGVVPYSYGNDLTVLKSELQSKEEELKIKNVIIEQIQKDNETLLATIEQLRNNQTAHPENCECETCKNIEEPHPSDCMCESCRPVDCECDICAPKHCETQEEGSNFEECSTEENNELPKNEHEFVITNPYENEIMSPEITINVSNEAEQKITTSVNL